MDAVLEINGEVLRPLLLSVEQVRAYTPYTVHARFINDDRTVETTFTGALLWDILLTAGLKPDATEKRRVIARAGDRFRCLLKWHEIDPATSDRQILVAYEQEGAPLSPKYGPLRLAVPGDERGQRYLRGLRWITVLDQTGSAESADEKDSDEA